MGRTVWYTFSFTTLSGVLFVLCVILASKCVLWVKWKDIFKILEFTSVFASNIRFYALFIRQREKLAFSNS
jgi:hypothetical protein